MSDAALAVERALELSERNRQSEAREALIAVAGESQSSARWHQVFGIVELRSGRIESAGEHFREAIAIEPQNAHHWFNLAGFYEQQGRPVDALKAIRRAVELDPQRPQNHLFAAELLLATGDGERGGELALQAHAQAMRLGGDPVQGALVLARINMARRQPAKAREALLEALKLAPDNAELQKAYASVLGSGQDAQEEAGELLRSVLASSPTDASARRELLRRLHTSLLRTRTVALSALVVAGLVFFLPRAAWSPVAYGGAIFTATLIAAGAVSARKLLGEESYKEYAAAHPGMRWGRVLAVIAAVIAWAPPAVLGHGNATPDARVVFVGVIVLVASALAWVGGGLVTSSLSADDFDPELPASRGLQRELWLRRHQGAARTAGRGSSLLLAVIAAAFSTSAPPGVGQAALALGLGGAVGTVADQLGRLRVNAAMRTGKLKPVEGEVLHPARAATASLLWIALAIAIASVCFAAGQANLRKDGETRSTNHQPPPPRLHPRVPNLTTVPSIAPPSIAPPTIQIPSFDLPSVGAPAE